MTGFCAICLWGFDRRPKDDRCGRCGAVALMYRAGRGRHVFYKGHSGTDEALAAGLSRLRADLLFEREALESISKSGRTSVPGRIAASIRRVANRLNIIAVFHEAAAARRPPKAACDAMSQTITADRDANPERHKKTAGPETGEAGGLPAYPEGTVSSQRGSGMNTRQGRQHGS